MSKFKVDQSARYAKTHEWVRMEDGVAHIEILPTERGKNVHPQGSDKYKGDILAKTGSILGAAEIGIAASIGKHTLSVKRLPRVLICSTGDELVEIDETPLAHQIRRSNAYALSALMRNLGIHASGMHLPDSADAVRESVSYGLNTYDVIILSGGVSKGKFDLLPEILSELRVDSVFHGIAQRPGKPMWFGKSNRTVVFALPGNPVSVFATFCLFVAPFIKKLQGRNNIYTEPTRINAAFDWPTPDSRREFTRARIGRDKDNRLHASLYPNQGSGVLMSTSWSDGFVDIAENSVIKSGDPVNYLSFKDILE